MQASIELTSLYVRDSSYESSIYNRIETQVCMGVIWELCHG